MVPSVTSSFSAGARETRASTESLSALKCRINDFNLEETEIFGLAFKIRRLFSVTTSNTLLVWSYFFEGEKLRSQDIAEGLLLEGKRYLSEFNGESFQALLQ